MLATKKFVKDTVYGMVGAENFRGMERRYWCERAADETKRNLAFKLGTPEEAEVAAEVLRAVLTKNGYTNTVRVTHTDSDPIYRRWGGDYVRVQVMNE